MAVAAAQDAFPYWHHTTISAALTAETASAAASTSASTSASAAPAASDPPAKAAALSPTPASPLDNNRTSASAAGSPSGLASSLGTATDAASESATSSEPDFPEVGLMHVTPEIVQTLMLQCLLPCLTPDHDFEQLVYAPWLRCFMLSVHNFVRNSKEAAFATNVQPHIELAGEICFFYCPSYMSCIVASWPSLAPVHRDQLAELHTHRKVPAACHSCCH